jgi:hypothetical protein
LSPRTSLHLSLSFIDLSTLMQILIAGLIGIFGACSAEAIQMMFVVGYVSIVLLIGFVLYVLFSF